MAKFKVGDKVKIIADHSRGQSKCIHIGKCLTISKYFDPETSYYNKDHYEFDELPYAWFDDELELVSLTVEKKREKLYDYCDNCPRFRCIKCPLYKFDCGRGHTWRTLLDNDVEEAYSIVFEKGEKDMKKFTKKDLKNGDVVKLRNGEVYIVVLDTGTLVATDGYINIKSIRDDLTVDSCSGNGFDIMTVRRPCNAGDCQFNAFKYDFGDLVYERKEVEEMTLEEVCKALGKDIKIVKK